MTGLNTGLNIEAVLFDLDGTLHHREVTIRRYLAGHVRRFSRLPPEYAGRWTELDRQGYTPKREVFETLVSEFDLPHQPETLLEDYARYGVSDCALMPGAREVLARLRQAGLRLGLVTNGWSGPQRAVLATLNVQDAFDVVLVSKEVGLGKPEAGIYQLALEQLAIPASHTLFVGDHPENDVRGPQLSGMKTAFLAGAFELPSGLIPDFSLRELSQLTTLLDL